MHIDWWTLALQTVNVLVLVWILSRFFFRPIMSIVARRQEEAARLLTDAENARRSAGAAQAATDRSRAELEAERRTLIEQAQDAAKAEKKALMEGAAKEIEKMRSDAALALGRERDAASALLRQRAGELSVDIARRLLGRLPPEVAFGAFLEGLCDELRVLPPEIREGFRPSGGKDGPSELATAFMLSEADRQRVRKEIAAAIGFDLPLVFRQEPELEAGLELKGATTIVRNSWRADLDHIIEELSRG